jgi:beta-N-acetylhexosaminidase
LPTRQFASARQFLSARQLKPIRQLMPIRRQMSTRPLMPIRRLLPTRRLWFKVGAVAGAGAVAFSIGAVAGARADGGTSRAGTATGRAAAGTRSSQVVAKPISPTPLSAAAQAALRAESGELAKLSIQQQAGQRVVYSYSGLNPPARLLYLIRHGEVGGVIFFGENISSEPQIAKVISELNAANAAKSNPARGYPLMLMTDQEGGEVRRLPGAPVMSEKQIGESAHPAAEAKKAGKGAAKNLLGVGMNINLAPVLDVYRKPGDFDDQYQRSYSMNPHVVSSAGAAFISAQQAGHVAATAKHFPGLGTASAQQNTDERPVTLQVKLATLRKVDEYPYKAAIKAGVKLVMVSWAVYPALDKSRPAGLSAKVVQGELEKRLGFTGVTITDSLGAGALEHYGTTGNRAQLAAQAGMDIILCSSQTASQGVACMNGLASGYRKGVLPKSQFEASVAEVLQLRSGLAK